MSSKHKWPSEKISPYDLLLLAREAAGKSYAPYSRFHVGSAILLASGEVIQSCNIENASYSLTICAERAGIAMMISQGKHKTRTTTCGYHVPRAVHAVKSSRSSARRFSLSLRQGMSRRFTASVNYCPLHSR